MRKTQSDPGFVQFEAEHYGIRAGAKNLLTYYRKHNRKTVRAIISAWAPPSDDNPTNTYVKTVAAQLRVSPDAEINLEDRDTMIALVTSMIQFECGSAPYTRSVIKAAVDAAYDSHTIPPTAPLPIEIPHVGQIIDEDLDPDVESTPVPTHKPTPAPDPQPPIKVTVIDTPMPPPREPDPQTAVPVPGTGTLPLVDQPSIAPSRKVIAGGLGGALAFIIAILWGKYMPDNPMPAEYALILGTALATGLSFLFSYVTRERASSVCPPTTTPSPTAKQGLL
jgi:hypothetical protein